MRVYIHTNRTAGLSPSSAKLALMSVDLREDKRIEAGVTAEILFGFWVYASSVDPAKIVACPPGV